MVGDEIEFSSVDPWELFPRDMITICSLYVANWRSYRREHTLHKYLVSRNMTIMMLVSMFSSARPISNIS